MPNGAKHYMCTWNNPKFSLNILYEEKKDDIQYMIG